jgi:hypothetical protein
MFNFAHDEHWTGCASDNAFGSAAGENMFQSCVAMGGEDYQVGVEFPGSAQNLRGRITVSNEDVHWDPASDSPGSELCELARDIGADKRLSGSWVDRAEWRDWIIPCGDVKQTKPCPELIC